MPDHRHPVSGNRVRFLRQCRDISAEQFAFELGISLRHLGRIENDYVGGVNSKTYAALVRAADGKPERLIDPVSSAKPARFTYPVYPGIAEFFDRSDVEMAAIDEFVQLTASPNWNGWTREKVPPFPHVEEYRPPKGLQSFMQKFPPEPGKARNFLYSLKSWRTEAFDPDAMRIGDEPALHLDVLGGRWDHVVALNGIWKSVSGGLPFDPACKAFRDEFEQDIVEIANGETRLYHNMNTEIILVTSDNKIVLARRGGMEFSMGRWTASLEEQVMRKKDDPKNPFSDDGDIFKCAHRGTESELGVTVIPDETRLLSCGIEWGNFTAAFLMLVKCEQTYKELIKAWRFAPERIEAVAVDCMSEQDIDEKLGLDTWTPTENARPRVDPPAPDGAIAQDFWHPTARARLYTYRCHRRFFGK